MQPADKKRTSADLPTLDSETRHEAPRDEVSSMLDTLAANHSGSDTVHRDAQRLGNYEIVEEIARGGMGVVYRARQINADRVVALKLIRGSDPDPKELNRFQAEARAAGKLDHPNIVPIYDVGVMAGEPFFTMKLIEGKSLSQRIDDKPLPAKLAAEIVRGVAEGIAHAHQNGIIHRDLKPGNILLNENHHPMVTDFGLAKLVGEESDLTRTGQAIGTPSYMPPEQASGDRKCIDRRSDVYSLGAVLYACLTGRPPFQGSTAMATTIAVVRDDPASPRLLNGEVPKDLETVCLKCLDKDPLQRYSSADELAVDLSRFLNQQPILARPASASERFVKWAKRNPAVAMLSAACIVAVMTVFVGAILYQNRLSTALEFAEQEQAKAERSDANRTALLYDSLVGQADFLNRIRPVGYGRQVRELIGQAKNLDTPSYDAKRLRQLLISGMGGMTYESPQTLTGLGGIAYSVDLTPDGDQIIVGTDQGEVLFYDRRTGRELARHAVHNDDVMGIRFVDSDTAYTNTMLCDQIMRWSHDGQSWQPDSMVKKWCPENVCDLRLTRDGRYIIGWTEVERPENASQMIINEVPLNFPEVLPPHSRFCLRPVESQPGEMLVTSLPSSTAFDDCKHYLVAGSNMRIGFHPLRNAPSIDAIPCDHGINYLLVQGDAESVVVNEHGGVYRYRLSQLEKNGSIRPKQISGRTSTLMQITENPPLLHMIAETSVEFLSLETESLAFEQLYNEGEMMALSRSGDMRFTISQDPREMAYASLHPAECRRLNLSHKVVDDVRFSPDGTTLISMGDAATGTHWYDLLDDRLITQLIAMRADFHPSGRYLALARDDETFAIVQTRDHSEVLTGKHRVSGHRIRFSPDGDFFFMHGWSRGQFELFHFDRKPQKADLLKQGELLPMQQDSTCDRSAAWSPSGNRLAWITVDSSSGKYSIVDQSPSNDSPPRHNESVPIKNTCCRLVMVDEERVCFVNDRDHLEVWDLAKGHSVVESTESFRRPICRSPDAKFVLAADKIASLDTLESVAKLPGLGGDPWSVDWSPDNRRVAIGYGGGAIAVWSLDTIGKRVRELDLPWPTIRQIALTPISEIRQRSSLAKLTMGREAQAIAMMSEAEYQEVLAVLATLPPREVWKTRLSEFDGTGPFDPSRVVDTILWLSENEPLTEVDKTFGDLLGYVNAFTATGDNAVPPETCDAVGRELVERLELIETPTRLTRAVAVYAYANQGSHQLARGDVKLSDAYFANCVTIGKQLIAEDARFRQWLGYRWYWGLTGLADVLSRASQSAEAIDCLERALALHDDGIFVAEKPFLTQARGLLVYNLRKVGRIAEANSMIARFPEVKSKVAEMHLPARWALNQKESAQLELESAGHAIHMTMSRAGKMPWHAEFLYELPELIEGQRYTLRFRARSDSTLQAKVNVTINHPNWRSIGLNETIETSANFQEFSWTFQASGTGDGHRIVFCLLEAAKTLIVKDIEFKRAAQQNQTMRIADET